MATRHQLLAYLSRKQFGLVTRAQLLKIGFSSSAITRAHHRGELAPYLPGVWRVTSAPRCWEQRPQGAVLWAGELTAVSHITSAYLQELLPRATASVEITTNRSPARRPGIIVHRCTLSPGEVVNVRGIPCTNVYRTLVEVCASQPVPTSEAALDAALRMERATFDRLRVYAENAAGRSVRGSATLRRLLSVRGYDEALSESEAESLFARLMRRAGLPIGQRQAPRDGLRRGRVDFLYPEQNLVIEIDGRRWHAGRSERKRDKRYDNELNIGGKRVLRLTWEDLTVEKAYMLDTVARALGIQALL